MVKADEENYDDGLTTDINDISGEGTKADKKSRKDSKKVPPKDRIKNDSDNNNKSTDSAQDKSKRNENITVWVESLIGIVVAVAGFGGCIFAFTQIKNGIESSLYTPNLSIGGYDDKIGDNYFTLDNAYKNMQIDIFTGKGYDTNIKTTVTVDGVEAEQCTENQSWSCDFKISYDKLDSSKLTHDVVATNQWGEDKITLSIKEEEQDTNSSSSWSSKPSTEDTKRTVAHLVCQNYIKQYFYPNAVKIHSILGVGMDQAYGESWQYGVDVTVTSAAGGEIMYKAICTVGEWQNLSAGAYDGASGSVIAFKVEPY